MKIEVCEQLIVSWLKHIEGCQIVQSNWAPSESYPVDEEDAEIFSLFIEDIKNITKDFDIFKKSTDSQLIRQTEIDVVGVRISGGKVEKIFLLDSAFHREGLGYSDNEARIAKKLVRAIGAAQIFFKGIPAEIMFVSPFARASVQNSIKEQMMKIEDAAKDLYPCITLTYLYNEEFAARVYSPLMSVIDLIKDDNELFVRSIQLMNTCTKSAMANKPEHNISVFKPLKTSPSDNKCIVFGALRKLEKAGKFSDKILLDLQDSNYTQKNFKISTYPFLITKSQFEKRFKTDELKRYYRWELFSYKGVNYVVCSQWIPERITLLNKWTEMILNKS